MNQIKPNPIFRLMPSLTDLAFLTPLVFLFARGNGLPFLLQDGDTGFHIRAGDWIRTHGAVPQHDIFSFTMPGQPWFAWEWLWDVGASLLHERWGLGGVVLANVFLLCLTFAILYRLIARRCGNPILSIGLTVLAAAGSTIHWLARPHLFTLLFTVIFMSILERVREGKTKLLWWLPVLTVLWTNLHGGFIVGIVILGVYGVGSLVKAALALEREERVAAVKASLKYFAVATGCLAASLINPYFYQLHVHIVSYLTDSYAINHVEEFQTANFHSPMAIFLEVMLALGAGAVAWLAMRKQYGEALLLIVWAHGALLSGRNIPLFMLMAAPLAGAVLVEWGKILQRTPVAGWVPGIARWFEEVAEEIMPIERIGRLHLFSAGVLAVIALAMSSAGTGSKFEARYDPKNYPEKALSVLKPSERVFTHDEWGDYLIYQLSPAGTKVFVDGRSDFYGLKFGESYIDLMKVKYDWESKLREYGVDTILLPASEGLASAVKESRNWRAVYDDGSAIVFRAVVPTAAEAPKISVGGNHVDSNAGSSSREGRGGNVTRPRSSLSEDRIFQTSGGQKL